MHSSNLGVVGLNIGGNENAAILYCIPHLVSSYCIAFTEASHSGGIV